MTRVLELPKSFPSDAEAASRAHWACEQLEDGNILLFPETPFGIPAEDIQFLLAQRQGDASYHKNIAYRPLTDRLTGYPERDAGQVDTMRRAMRNYAERAIAFASNLLAPYAAAWHIDFTSFRPQQEQGRVARVHARNDLLHCDSFPTRATNGNRILRLFTNINASEPRVWNTGGTFEGLATRYAGTPGLPAPKTPTHLGLRGLQLARALGFRRLASPPYDRWMLRFHHFLKENEEFQRTTPRSRWEFPHGATWLVFTDMVSHAVLSGQFALEQTFMVSKDSLVAPQKAPVSVLERLAAGRLTLSE